MDTINNTIKTDKFKKTSQSQVDKNRAAIAGHVKAFLDNGGVIEMLKSPTLFIHQDLEGANAFN